MIVEKGKVVSNYVQYFLNTFCFPKFFGECFKQVFLRILGDWVKYPQGQEVGGNPIHTNISFTQ